MPEIAIVEETHEDPAEMNESTEFAPSKPEDDATEDSTRASETGEPGNVDEAGAEFTELCALLHGLAVHANDNVAGEGPMHQTTKKALDDIGVSYEVLPVLPNRHNLTIKFSANFNGLSTQVVIFTKELERIFQYYVYCPVRVPENKRTEAALFLTRVNYGLLIGRSLAVQRLIFVLLSCLLCSLLLRCM
jgi:hypothetical protein